MTHSKAWLHRVIPGNKLWVLAVICLSFSAAAWQDMLGLGQAMHYTSYNGSAWTNTTTKRAPIGLIVSKIDDGNGLGRASYNLGGLA